MGSARNNAKTLKKSDKWRLTPESSAVEENVQAVKRWERAILLARSKAEQLSDWIACTAGERAGLTASCALVRRVGDCQFRPGRTSSPVRPVSVSLPHDDCVVGGDLLGAFVLASQNRLSRQADKRSHLDLQIDLLAEREMTAVLQLLQDIAEHLEVRTTVTPEQLRDLMKKTDLRQLTNRMEELAEPVVSPPLIEPGSKENSRQQAAS